jgi:hypothetical protein
VLSFLLAVGPTTLVSAEIMIRFIFNDGRAPSIFEGTYCSSTENSSIDAIFDLKTLLGRRRRQLRLTSDTNSTISAAPLASIEPHTDSRGLAYPRKCKDNCAGLAKGTCRATDCVGYRRRKLMNEIDEMGQERSLATEQCPALVELVHAKLDALDISSTCRKFLDKSKRITTCLDDIIYGEIEGVRLWKVSYMWSTVLQESMPVTGYSFCRGMSFNLESINNDCVESALMVLKGPNNYEHTNFETDTTFTLFKDLGVTMMGQKVPTAGEYTLSIIPDGLDYKKKTFTFTVNNC